MPISQEGLSGLAAFYRDYLIQGIAAFWEPRTEDTEYGGYFVSFDRAGNRTGEEKNIWCQGRQLYVFASLYTHIEQRERWLALAKTGRDFLVKHAYTGNGRWHYLLDRSGHVLNASSSVYTDAFVLIGLCEHAVAAGSDEDRLIIQKTYEQFEQHVMDPDFSEYHHFVMQPGILYHGPHMMGVYVASIVRSVLGDARIRALSDYCMHKVLHVFAKDEYEALFEMLDRNERVMSTPAGQTLNPGHVFESSWFCMEEALYRKDRALFERAARMADWAYHLGHDSQYGGILAFVDPKGHRPRNAENTDSMNPWDERWDDKIWWVHSESLYTLALSALELDDAELFERFHDLHEYCFTYFADPEYGEWYSYLNRNNTPRVTAKGNWIRSAFHNGRSMMRLALLFERFAAASKE